MSVTPQTVGAALAPLSGPQRQKLAIIARKAYDVSDSSLSFDQWRQSEVMKCVSRPGLRECENQHYLPIKAHFEQLLGRDHVALNDHLRHQKEPRTWALAKLTQEAAKAADVLPNAMAYARGFLQSKRQIRLEDAGEKDIWNAIFTVRRKAQALRKQAVQGGTASKAKDVAATTMKELLKKLSKKQTPEPIDDNDPF